MLTKLIFKLYLVTIPFMACSSPDSGGSSATLAYGGKGANPLTDGLYDLSLASYEQSDEPILSEPKNSYTLADNAFQARVSFDSIKGRYSLQFIGFATYKFDGESFISGCDSTSRSRSYTFQLSDSNEVQDLKLEKDEWG